MVMRLGEHKRRQTTGHMMHRSMHHCTAKHLPKIVCDDGNMSSMVQNQSNDCSSEITDQKCSMLLDDSGSGRVTKWSTVAEVTVVMMRRMSQCEMIVPCATRSNQSWPADKNAASVIASRRWRNDSWSIHFQPNGTAQHDLVEQIQNMTVNKLRIWWRREPEPERNAKGTSCAARAVWTANKVMRGCARQ